MSDEKPMESNSADELTKTKKPGDVQLSEEEMKQVAGGLKIKMTEVFITSIQTGGSGGGEPTE